MADKIDNKIFQSMLTSADADATQTWQEMNLYKPTDLGESEQALSIVKGLIGLDGGEVYNEEGEVIAIGGSPPDLAFSPLATKSSIKNIEITFSDGRGNTVDFNNIPYTLILIAEFQFDPNSAITLQNQNLNQAPPRSMIQDEEMKKQMINMLMNKKQKI